MTSQSERRRRRRENAEQARMVAPGARVAPSSAIQAIEEEIEARARRQEKPRRVDRPLIERLHASGSISTGQRRAFEALERDWYRSGLDPWATAPDGVKSGSGGHMPGCGPGYSRYTAAMRAVGPILSPVLAAALLGEAPTAWAVRQGRHDRDGPAALRLACDALSAHYQASKEQAA